MRGSRPKMGGQLPGFDVICIQSVTDSVSNGKLSQPEFE